MTTSRITIILLLLSGAIFFLIKKNDLKKVSSSKVESIDQKVIHQEGHRIQSVPSQVNEKEWSKIVNFIQNDQTLGKEIDTISESLSSDMRTQLREYYNSLPKEDRSRRGLIVYLVGSKIQSQDDYQFLADVLMESPCLSLVNCDSQMSDSVDEVGVNEITLKYPQKMALELLKRNSTDDERKEVLKVLEKATFSNDPMIAQESKNLYEQEMKIKL